MSGKYALVIGNTEYSDPGLAKLTAPGKDAQAFARVLQSKEICGFDDVKALLNQPEPVVRDAIDSLFDQKKPDDLLVLYFSGHGVRDEYGSLYLAVQNTNRLRLRATAIKSDFIRESMDESRSRRQVLILDCCNSGAFAQGTKGATGVSIGTASAFEGTGYGRVVLTASDATQFAWEGDKVIGQTENSLFTHFLVKGLEGEADQDSDGRITIDELYDYAYGQIVNVTPKQTPGKWSYKQQGEIVLRQSTRVDDIKPVQLPDDLLEEAEDTRPYVREAVVQKLAKILQGRNIGMARSAKAALEKIVADDNTTRRVALAATQALEDYERGQDKPAEAAGAAQPQPPVEQPIHRPGLLEQAEAKLRAREITQQLARQTPKTETGKRRLPFNVSRRSVGIAAVAIVVLVGLGYAATTFVVPMLTPPKPTATARPVMPGVGAPVILKASEAVYDVAFSPDGRILASGSQDKNVTLWDVSTHKSIGGPMIGHTERVSSVAFSPDGKYIASGSDDNTIILWDVTTRLPIGLPLTGHSDAVTSVAFSPDGKTLASSSRDATVRLWDVETRQPIGAPLRWHTGEVYSVAFSPDGKRLASAGADQIIILWDVATRQPVGEPLRKHTRTIFKVVFSPDGKTLASASADNTVILWDVATQQPIGEPFAAHTDYATGLSFTPDGRTLASGSMDGTVVLWDVERRQPLGPALAADTNSVFGLGFSPDGQTLAVATQDSAIVLWNLTKVLRISATSTPVPTATIQAPQPLPTIPISTFSPSG